MLIDMMNNYIVRVWRYGNKKIECRNVVVVEAGAIRKREDDCAMHKKQRILFRGCSRREEEEEEEEEEEKR